MNESFGEFTISSYIKSGIFIIIKLLKLLNIYYYFF